MQIPRFILVLLIACLTLPLPLPANGKEEAQPPRAAIQLDEGWTYASDPQGDAPRDEWARALPNATSLPPFDSESNADAMLARDGVSWYARELTIPEQMGPAGGLLVFESIVGEADIYLDGELLSHVHGNGLPHRIQLRGTPGTRHLLVMRLDRRSLSSVQREILSCRFGPVRIELLPTVWIQAVRVRMTGRDNSITVRYRLMAEESCRVNLGISLLGDRDERVISKIEPFSLDLQQGIYEGEKTLSGKRMKAWSVKTPVLYRLRVQISRPGKTGDLYQATTGYSAATLDVRNRLLVNGSPVVLRGLRLSGGAPRRASSSLAAEFQLARQAGYNAIMADGAAFSEAVLDAADRQGLMVIAEIPSTGESAAPEFSRILEENGRHPSIIGWRWDGHAAIGDISAMRALDSSRFIIARSPAGTSIYPPPPALSTGIPIADFDTFTYTSDLPFATVLEQAENADAPMLVSGTMIPAAGDDSLDGQRKQQMEQSAVRQMIESVLRSDHPFGYFTRPSHGASYTGLRTPDGKVTGAYHAALATNHPHILALRVRGTGDTRQQDLCLINGVTSMDSRHDYVLYRLLTTPEGTTQMYRVGTETPLAIAGKRVVDLSSEFPAIPVQPGEYRLQFILMDGDKVDALSQVVPFTVNEQ